MRDRTRFGLKLVLCILVGVTMSARPLTAQSGTRTGPVELQVNNLVTPLGIDDPSPSFSWQLKDPARGAKQAAYQVSVASSPELAKQSPADIWTSGRVESWQSLNVKYAGPALKPSTRYWWTVKV